ncbi:50S ribosomal protein L33, partial [bacterium]|nr:50S ribosomal protein L33 [bacterium]
MAKVAKEALYLVSSEGTGFFYTLRVNKKKRRGDQKLSLKKYDPIAQKHVLFEEKLVFRERLGLCPKNDTKFKWEQAYLDTVKKYTKLYLQNTQGNAKSAASVLVFLWKLIRKLKLKGSMIIFQETFPGIFEEILTYKNPYPTIAQKDTCKKLNEFFHLRKRESCFVFFSSKDADEASTETEQQEGQSDETAQDTVEQEEPSTETE